jgi:uncharacterized membrane protein
MSEYDTHSSTHRLEAFSDGVFAIAITLLIIEIGVPHVEGEADLGDELWDLWPSYGAYILSFVMIGIYWANHHSFFELFGRTDHVFLMVNVLFLMTIAFIPFPTAVLGEYLDNDAQRQDAVILYAIGLLLPALTWFAIWVYARARGLLVAGLRPSYVRFMTYQYGLSCVLFTLSLAIALVEPWASLAVTVGLTLLYLLPPRRPQFVGEHSPIQRDHVDLGEP